MSQTRSPLIITLVLFVLSFPSFAGVMPVWDDKYEKDEIQGRMFAMLPNYFCVSEGKILAEPILKIDDAFRTDLGLAIRGEAQTWKGGGWASDGRTSCLNPQAVKNLIDGLEAMEQILRLLARSPEE